MHCNLRPPDATPVLSRFIRRHAKFEIAAPCRIAFLLLIHYFYAMTFTFDLWHWTFALHRLWRDVPNMNAIRVRVIGISIFYLWPWTGVTYGVLGSAGDNFQRVRPSTTCLNYSVFSCWYVMSRCDLDLWPLDLELLQHFRYHVVKFCAKF